MAVHNLEHKTYFIKPKIKIFHLPTNTNVPTIFKHCNTIATQGVDRKHLSKQGHVTLTQTHKSQNQ